MAKEAIIVLKDDLDGSISDDVQTRRFRFDREMELTEANYARVAAILDGALAKARNVGRGNASVRVGQRTTVRVNPDVRERNRRIRTWALDKGYKLPIHGRPRKDVEAAYVAETGDAR